MKNGELNEPLLDELCDSFLSAMQLSDDGDTPELVYAVIQALIERIGPEGYDFIQEAFQECLFMACGGPAETH